MNRKIIKENVGKLNLFIINYSVYIAFIFFILDIILKNIFYKNELFYLRNFGISFGLLPNINWLIINSVLILIIMFLWIYFNDLKTPLFFIIVGGMGNILDRIIYGFVIDYIPFILTYINLSDVIISLGLISYILNSFFNN